MYMSMCIYLHFFDLDYVYVYISLSLSQGLCPLPPAPSLRLGGLELGARAAGLEGHLGNLADLGGFF